MADFLFGIHPRLGEDSPVSLLDTTVVKAILKWNTEALVVRCDSRWISTPDAPEECDTTTYLIKKGMFSGSHWDYLVGMLQDDHPRSIHEAPFPKSLGAIFLDALAGSDFEGCEVDSSPDITLSIDFKYEDVFNGVSRRVKRINKVRNFLGKLPYAD
jgi:hypothetical protein